MKMTLLALLLGLCGTALFGCRDDLTRFSTSEGESYCGGIVQGPPEAFREGFGPAVQMRMTFDANHMEDPASSPGSVATSDGQTHEQFFKDAPLRVIPKLNNDPLSMLQFGEGRDRNLIYMIEPSDPQNGPTVTAVVSLLHNGNAEARLIRGAPPLPDAGELPPRTAGCFSASSLSACPGTMRVLGIESSCDETAAAVVDDDGRVYADVIKSQVALHAPYGGVVPEVASRAHLGFVTRVVREAMARAAVGFSDIDGVAVTARPGLAGALLVGVQAAKGIAWGADLPIVAVDHLVGHLLAVFLRREGEPTPPSFPFVALLASGGHTAIYRVDGPSIGRIRELGATRDDAAGEAFDKVANALGLGYPGGPVVDRLAAAGNPKRFPVAVPMARNDSLEFSFSGVKTAVVRKLTRKAPSSESEIADVCAGFQHAVVDSLVSKTIRAATSERVSTVVLAGGVAANRGLRSRAAEACANAGLSLHVPPLASCTDNAAMIAYAGALRLAAGERDDFSFTTSTRTALLRLVRKGGGRRPPQSAVG